MLRDMEMVQFHPTGLLAGPGTRMTGTVLEEGLRGAGGYLLNGANERFMAKYDARGRACHARHRVARHLPGDARPALHADGGVFLGMAAPGPRERAQQFKGMVDRCGDCGFDLAGGLVEVVPTAHYMMGGLEFAADCRTAMPGLFAAGEDTGGVHGANRLGGNGVANSTVFGGHRRRHHGRRGRATGRIARARPRGDTRRSRAASARSAQARGDLEPIRERLYEVMWTRSASCAMRRASRGRSRPRRLDGALDARRRRQRRASTSPGTTG